MDGDLLHGLLSSNERFSEHFDLGELSRFPSGHLALLTCLDTRIDPLAAFGLRVGEVVILRNAGGRVTDDALRSLSLATGLLGVTTVVVLQHSDCALAGRSDEELRSAMSSSLAKGTADVALLGMPDPDVALRDDVAMLRSSHLLAPGTTVEGWRYDVTNGRVTPVSDNAE